MLRNRHFSWPKHQQPQPVCRSRHIAKPTSTMQSAQARIGMRSKKAGKKTISTSFPAYGTCATEIARSLAHPAHVLCDMCAIGFNTLMPNLIFLSLVVLELFLSLKTIRSSVVTYFAQVLPLVLLAVLERGKTGDVTLESLGRPCCFCCAA